VPRIATSVKPGDHVIRAVGTTSHEHANAPFTVRTDWTQFRFDQNHTGVNPYENVINAFSNPLATIFYVIAMLALGLHLYHGFWSMFQTLGLNNYRTDRILRIGAGVVAVVLTLGFIAVPLAVLFGIVS